MTPYRKRTCQLTRRLAEDMMIRNMADATIDAYTYHVRKFYDFTGKPLDQATSEDVRTFQLHLIQERKLAYSTFNQAVCALRFLYTHTIRVPWPVTMVPYGKRPKTLPTVLGRQEVDRLIQCTANLKHRTFLMTLYSGGLRFPGGGPSLADGSWKPAAAPPVEGFSEERAYLVDAINLRRSFRKYAIAHLQRLRKAGKLRYGGSLESLRCDAEWDAMIERIEGQEWVSHIEPPPTETSRAEHVVRYLTRYLTGGPISDHRIVAADDREVTFLARQGERVGGERQQVPLTLKTGEFVRRWCLHIQPDQLTKTRCWGGWSNRRAERYLAQCRKAFEESHHDRAGELADAGEREAAFGEAAASLSCEHCGSESLTLIEEQAKPTWETLLSRGSECSPRWYTESQEIDDIRFWDGAMGEGFSEWYAWYLKSEIESARESTESIPPPTQLTLPGFHDEAGINPRQRF